ncbi:arylsulfatase I-like [Ptychodera flava]|uniref:arylsulfatase I-like n=1 Tax=Ptychodera flava TaxID=63121 RepID=UPI00396A8FFD
MKIFVVCLAFLLICHCQAHNGSNGYWHHGSNSGSDSSGSHSKSSSEEGGPGEPPCGAGRPHIIVFVADDFGWNDFGENGSTPFLLSLAEKGVEFNNSYVLPLSTPTRNALFTGLYPHRTGMQHLEHYPRQPYGLPTNFTILPQKLKDLCYSTHGVGKWHLGFCADEYLPRNRGFDTFYGTYTDVNDLFDKTSFDPLTGEVAYDLYNDGNLVPADNEHLAEKLTRRSVRIIKRHRRPSKNPLFLYHSFQLSGSPDQVPENVLERFNSVVNPNRQAFLALSSMMDSSVRRIVRALKRKRMLDNTLILFTSSNGGDASQGGNNFPLRGNKGTCYEGGMRVPTFVWGNMLNVNGTQDGLIHAVDWVPTLCSIAGGANIGGDIDGLDQSAMVINGTASARSSVVLALDDIRDSKAAYREGDLKLIDGEPSYWYPLRIDSETNGHYAIPTGVSSPVMNFYDIILPGLGPQPPPPVSLPQTLLFDLAIDETEMNDISSTSIINVLLMQMTLNTERGKAKGSAFIDDPSSLPAAGAPTNSGLWPTDWCQAMEFPLPPALG